MILASVKLAINTNITVGRHLRAPPYWPSQTRAQNYLNNVKKKSIEQCSYLEVKRRFPASGVGRGGTADRINYTANVLVQDKEEVKILYIANIFKAPK